MKRTGLPSRKTPMRRTAMLGTRGPMRKRRAGKRLTLAVFPDLRSFAKGKPCMVRLPTVCNGNPETTVLAHYRLAGLCGTGMKPNDLVAAWACSTCHDECDRRTRVLERDSVRLAHAEGMARTLDELISLHVIGAIAE